VLIAQLPYPATPLGDPSDVVDLIASHHPADVRFKEFPDAVTCGATAVSELVCELPLLGSLAVRLRILKSVSALAELNDLVPILDAKLSDPPGPLVDPAGDT
jgi:hypothetical protein